MSPQKDLKTVSDVDVFPQISENSFDVFYCVTCAIVRVYVDKQYKCQEDKSDFLPELLVFGIIKPLQKSEESGIYRGVYVAFARNWGDILGGAIQVSKEESVLFLSSDKLETRVSPRGQGRPQKYCVSETGCISPR